MILHMKQVHDNMGFWLVASRQSCDALALGTLWIFGSGTLDLSQPVRHLLIFVPIFLSGGSFFLLEAETGCQSPSL